MCARQKDGLQDSRAAAAAAWPAIEVQHLVLSEGDIGIVQTMLDQAGAQLAIRFELRPDRGDIVLLDAALAAGASPHLIHAFSDERPVVVIAGSRGSDPRQLSVAERFELRQHELLHQLRKLLPVRQRATTTDPGANETARGVRRGDRVACQEPDFDPHFDAEMAFVEARNDACSQLLQHAWRGWHQPDTAELTASYGRAAHVRFDFGQRVVTIDALALQHLRSRLEMPVPAHDARPGPHATVLPLQTTLWDLGIAGAAMPLIDAPQDWIHAPLTTVAMPPAQSLTRVPRYLDVLRRMQAAAVTPALLRRQTRLDVIDLRRVLQACLLSGLARWTPPTQTQEKL